MSYTVRNFLEDERRLLATSDPAPPALLCVERPDGRLLRLPTDPLRQAMTREPQASRCFELRYGPQGASEHERRFRLVLDYVDAHRGKLAEAGLAKEGDAFAVREEFIDWLLSCDVEASRREIPESALTRFLDQWGHRWL